MPMYFVNFARTPFMSKAAKRQPLGVDRSLSPFLDMIYSATTYVQIKGNSILGSGPPPSPLNCVILNNYCAIPDKKWPKNGQKVNIKYPATSFFP